MLRINIKSCVCCPGEIFGVRTKNGSFSTETSGGSLPVRGGNRGFVANNRTNFIEEETTWAVFTGAMGAFWLSFLAGASDYKDRPTGRLQQLLAVCDDTLACATFTVDGSNLGERTGGVQLVGGTRDAQTASNPTNHFTTESRSI